MRAKWRDGSRFAGGLALCALLGLCGCASLGADPSLSAAQVRFVELSPGSPEMDFYVNGTGAAYGIGFESFTSYLPVSPGAASLSVNRAGFGQVLVASQNVLLGGHQYTAIVSHGLGSLQEHVYPDGEMPAPPGQVALRVINEVEGVGALTVYISAGISPGISTGISPARGNASSIAALNVTGGSASGYVNAPTAAGGYTVIATVGDRSVNLPVGSVTVKLGSGAVRTVVFAGTVLPGGHGSVVGFTLTDADPF